MKFKVAYPCQPFEPIDAGISRVAEEYGSWLTAHSYYFVMGQRILEFSSHTDGDAKTAKLKIISYIKERPSEVVT